MFKTFHYIYPRKNFERVGHALLVVRNRSNISKEANKYRIALFIAELHARAKFSLLSVYGKRWMNWERHFIKHHSRAVLLALAKSMYYLLYTTLDSSLRKSSRAFNFRSRVPRSPTVWVYVNFVEFMGQGRCLSGIGRPDMMIKNANTCRKRKMHIKNNLQLFLSCFGTVYLRLTWLHYSLLVSQYRCWC